MTENSWLEVSLTVNGELAEAVADVLARFAPNGVTTEQGLIYNDAEDAGTPFGPITVRAYLPVDEQLEETRQRLEEALHYLGMIETIPTPTFTSIADQNWMEAWKARYQPIPIGEKLIIVPAWMDSPDESRISIKIDPGMAFGTGTHPTTQLSLELLEKYMTDDINEVIDVGCGSAILSVAAIKLGATRALGVDIDEPAVTASRENAEANSVADKILLGQGSVDEILAGSFAFTQAPLVLANILAPILIRLLDAGLSELVTPGGVLILSGVLDHQEQEVISAAQAHGLAPLEQCQIGDWVALALKR